MSLTIAASEVAHERWVRVCCGKIALHECKFDEAMHFEGNNYYPHGSRLLTECFSPSDLFWKHSMMGLASFFHFTKPDSGDLVKDVMWKHSDPSPGYEFLTLYVGYDMNKTYVKIFNPLSPTSSSASPTSSSTTSRSHLPIIDGPSPSSAFLVDGIDSPLSGSTSSGRSRAGSSSGRSLGGGGGGGVGMERGGSRGTGSSSSRGMQVDHADGGSEGGSSVGSVPERGRTNRDMPVRRASLGGRGG